MNLVYGEIVDIGMEGQMHIGSVRVSGAIKKVPLDLIPGVECGDTILMCDGVAIGKINDPQIDPRSTNYRSNVSGDSR